MQYAYFDHNATSTLDPRVRDAMVPWLGADHGNPSSLHRYGQSARAAIELARDEIAALIGATAAEIVLTASGTEANNAVLQAVGRAHRWRGHLVISSIEHASIRRGAELLVDQGMTLTVVDPEPGTGVVSLAAMVAALRPDTRLVCLMLANNEVGTLQPVAELARLARERGIPTLCDAVQAAGKLAIDVGDLGVAYLSIGAHKFHGPLGAAALWIEPQAPFEAFLVGGSQERRRRASTENTPAVVGFGEACRLARCELPQRISQLVALRDRLETGLAAIPDAAVHFASSPRLPHVANLVVRQVRNEDLLVRLDLAGFAVSTGPACSSGSPQPSQVLLACGVSREDALSSLRVSFGLPNNLAEVDAFLVALGRSVSALRGGPARQPTERQPTHRQPAEVALG